MEKKLQAPYLTNHLYTIYYSLLIAQDLWQAHYQILLLISMKEIIKLNETMENKIKNAKCVELNTKNVSAALNTQMLKMIY